jgi:hypothetical protein
LEVESLAKLTAEVQGVFSGKVVDWEDLGRGVESELKE